MRLCKAETLLAVYRVSAPSRPCHQQAPCGDDWHHGWVRVGNAAQLNSMRPVMHRLHECLECPHAPTQLHECPMPQMSPPSCIWAVCLRVYTDTVCMGTWLGEVHRQVLLARSWLPTRLTRKRLEAFSCPPLSSTTVSQNADTQLCCAVVSRTPLAELMTGCDASSRE